MSKIASFYSGKSVLLTGGTGFLGHVLTDKLLRSCPGLKTLYLIVRPKDDLSPQDRVDKMLKDQFFDRARREVPGFEEKVVALGGDCEKPGLALDEEDRRRLVSSANIVIHSSASISFRESLKKSISSNYMGTANVLTLAKQLQDLKSLVYVSTAYSHCNRKDVDEKVYPPPITHESLRTLYNNFDDVTCERLSEKIRQGRPNNYTAVKAVTEDFVRQEMNGLPACIFRPSTIAATNAEPVPGWSNSWFSANGAQIHPYRGSIHSVQMDPTKSSSLVPCDMTANAILAAAAKTGERGGESGEIPVYNFVTSRRNLVSYKTMFDHNSKYSLEYPSSKAVGYPKTRFIKNPVLFTLSFGLTDVIPAVIKDIPSILTFRKKRNIRRLYTVWNFLDSVTFFMTRDWAFGNSNVESLWSELTPEDKKTFPFDMSSIDWESFMKNFLIGARIYLLKDPLDTLDEGKRLMKRFYYRRLLARVLSVAVGGGIIWIYLDPTLPVLSQQILL